MAFAPSSAALNQSARWALQAAQRAQRCQEVPVGAVLMRGDQRIARAHNRMKTWETGLAHAEVLVILMGQKKLKQRYLSDCWMMVTLQPCNFCLAAMEYARLGGLYFGAYQKNLGFLPPRDAIESFPTIGGIQETSCQMLLEHFFQSLRS